MKWSSVLSVILLVVAFAAVSKAIGCFYCDGGPSCADPYDKDYSRTSKIECTQQCFKDVTTYPASSNLLPVVRRGCSASKCQKGCKGTDDSGTTCRSCCRRSACNTAAPTVTGTAVIVTSVLTAMVVRYLV